MSVAPVMLSVLLAALVASPPQKASVFSRDNLVAWCIVPFDAKHRGPKERADMLVGLRIRRVAYDWRDQHVAEWDKELEQYKSRGIELVGFWAPDRNKQILDLLKRHGLRAQLWMMLAEPKGDTSAARVDAAAATVLPVAKLADTYGCTVGLYNHGGWVGEPENMVAIVEKLKRDGAGNVGIVYNLHHGHEHLDRFPAAMKLMRPHLMCLTINGMKKGGEKILPVGRGDDDLSLLKTIRDSGYAGPIAILNHREEMDAEAGLRQNIDGLKALLGHMGEVEALKTYQD